MDCDLYNKEVEEKGEKMESLTVFVLAISVLVGFLTVWRLSQNKKE